MRHDGARRKPEQFNGLPIAAFGNLRLKGIAPFERYLLDPIKGTGDHAENRARGVCITTPVDHIEHRRLETRVGKQCLKYRLQCFHDIGTGVIALHTLEGVGREVVDKPLRQALQHRHISTLQRGLHHLYDTFRAGIGQGIVMRDVGLDARGPDNFLRWRTEAGQGHRQTPHAGAVTGIVFCGGDRRPTRLAKVHHTAPHRVADIDGFLSHPIAKRLGDDDGIEGLGIQYCLAQRQAHLGIIGYLSWPQMQPAGADDPSMNAVLGLNFAGRHEFHGGAQGVTDGEPQISGLRTSNEIWGNEVVYVG